MKILLFEDKKIQDGVDKRSYRVSFDYSHQVIPGYKANWKVEDGIIRLIDDLYKINLDEVKFKQKDFYRLQQLDHLFQTNQITQDLYWN